MRSPKILLVADRRTASPEMGSSPVRRYRLARLRLDGRVRETGSSRFEYLKRSYD